jgi:hypothetical protein
VVPISTSAVKREYWIELGITTSRENGRKEAHNRVGIRGDHDQWSIARGYGGLVKTGGWIQKT